MPSKRLVIEMVEDDMARVLRSKTGSERLDIANRMFTPARKMLLIALRVEHPDWDEDHLRRETARRMSHGAL